MDAANRHLRTARIQQQVKAHKLLTHLNKRVAEGTTQIHCPSPSHPERNPSARLYAETNSVHCFGCGGNWNVVQLAALIRGTTQDEAIEWIDRAFNLPPIGDAAVDMVQALVRGQTPTSDAAVVMQRLRQAKSRMDKARYLRAWVLFDRWRSGELDIETAQQVRETIDAWTREALGAV